MKANVDWLRLLRRPRHCASQGRWQDWFDGIAARLLNGCRLVAAGLRHRLVEIEFYYHTESHPDPFSHRQPVQRAPGLWYFHRIGSSYRGGTFKGLDLSFGCRDAFGGILIRGLETTAGKLIDGPSLCVDYLLRTTGSENIAALDRAIAGRLAWTRDNALRLEDWSGPTMQIFRTTRVGLSPTVPARRADDLALRKIYHALPYRYLTEPRRIRKGRAALLQALESQGLSLDAIHEITGSPMHHIRRRLRPQE